MQEPVILRAPAKSISVLIFVVLLAGGPGCAWAQETAEGFADVSARAAAARDSGNIPLAIDLYGQAEKLKPDWEEGWFYLGALQYGSNQFAAAIDAFNHLLQLEPKAVPGMALRGLCEFETGAYDDALKDLDMAVAHGAANEPRNAQILRYRLAQLLTRASRFQDAIKQYKFFTQWHIDDPEVLVGLALAGMRIPMFPKDVAAKNREEYQAAGAAGYAFLTDETIGADEQFQALFAHYPTALNLHLFYGFLLFPHSPELAVDQFRAELALAPENISAHAMLAFTLMLAGRYTEALPEAERAYADAPDMEMTQISLGRSLAETGDVKRGEEMLKQVLKTDPDNMEAHEGLAAIYSRAGKREDAYRERMVCLGLVAK